jgi:hypothetical protein
VDQSFENILPQEGPKLPEGKSITLGKFKIKLRTLYLLVGLLVLLLVVLLIAASFKVPTVQPPAAKPSPSPTPTPIEATIASPSAYASDSAILRMEGELEVIEDKIQATDLKESGLNPPVLDMNVDFKG